MNYQWVLKLKKQQQQLINKIKLKKKPNYYIFIDTPTCEQVIS